jgi:septum formation protein
MDGDHFLELRGAGRFVGLRASPRRQMREYVGDGPRSFIGFERGQVGFDGRIAFRNTCAEVTKSLSDSVGRLGASGRETVEEEQQRGGERESVARAMTLRHEKTGTALTLTDWARQCTTMSRVPLLVLASGSPRRRELLSQQGLDFDVVPAHIDEDVRPDEEPFAYALRLAIEKASAIAEKGREPRVVLGADTIVVCDGKIYGKPTDAGDAVRILETLCGRNHVVVTAWAVVRSDAPEAGVTGFSRSVVRMREASRFEICDYVATGESMDKAGAYAAQGEGGRFVAAIDGAHDNVIGLPVAPVLHAIAALTRLSGSVANE